MLQGAEFEYLQDMVKDNGEAITTWCLLELTFLEECWKRFGHFSDFYQKSSSCWSSGWISSPRTQRAAQGTLHEVWNPTTGSVPQDGVELHPAVRTAGSRREWGMLLLPINPCKADCLPCRWQNPEPSPSCLLLPDFCWEVSNSWKLQKASRRPIQPPPCTALPSQPQWQQLLSLAIAGCSKTSIHPTAPSPSWALPVPPAQHTGECHSRDRVQVQQEQILQRTAGEG